jgi:hypothetical protein
MEYDFKLATRHKIALVNHSYAIDQLLLAGYIYF